MGEDPASPMTGLIIILLLLIIHAFLSASEMALVSSEKNKFEELADDGDARAEKVLRLLRVPSRFLQTIHVCTILTSFLYVSIAATTVAPTLSTWLYHRVALPFLTPFFVLIFVFILAYISLLLCESVPKRIALQNPESFSLSAVGALTLFSRLMHPFVYVLGRSTNLVLSIMGIDIRRTEEQVTREEIRSIVEVGQEQGVINPVERDMIESVISFDDRQAEEIMTARTEVFMIDAGDPPEEYLSEMLNLKYSRIPVYEDNPDNIIGVLYLKDYLLHAYKRKSFDKVNIRGILRPAYFVPERKNINDLFNDMQSTHRHMALLIDEYGGFSGMVTMEDLVEEIVGDIDDEYDQDEPDIIRIDDRTFKVKGATSIKEFNSELDTDIDEDSDDYDTVGGFLINLLDYIPEDGETPVVEFENLVFHIRKVEEKRIKDIRVSIEDDEQESHL